MLIMLSRFKSCTRVMTSLLMVVGLTGFWQSQLNAGAVSVEPSPKELSQSKMGTLTEVAAAARVLRRSRAAVGLVCSQKWIFLQPR